MALNVSQVNEKSAEEKNIDEWLLITSFRNAKMVVFCFSQRHCHGWRQRPEPALCQFGAWMVMDHHASPVTGHHLVLAVANGSHPQNGSGYSPIAGVDSVKKEVLEHVDYTPRGKTMADNVFNFFSALGDVAFAYAVALVGFYMFGNSVEDNILNTMEKPNWLVAMANLFVVIHLIGGYQKELQIFAMPVFDMIETYPVKKMKFAPSSALCFTVRTLYVGKIKDVPILLFIGFPVSIS
ncbi:lysine histidine transporter 2 [Actinidia rufa]|uniref:Lysine histidine transporter 2 n=1 Tax=Actinidia rufa TaxID=165716 RepID=A0A7J0ENX0_9ERIC|nr:lysine histidine transporter 2 [Actinidia rufa]